MRVTFHEKHNSINAFDSFDLPAFSVLTGLNGSGKTHLLKAIELGKVKTDDKAVDDIVYFDFTEFFLQGEAQVNTAQIVSEKNSAWKRFLEIQDHLRGCRKKLGNAHSSVVKACQEKALGILGLSREDLTDENDWLLYDAYQKSVHAFFNHEDRKKQTTDQAIYAMQKKLRYSIDEISEIDFHAEYVPYQFKKNFLPDQIGKSFWNYFVRWDKNYYDECWNKKHGTSRTVLTDIEFVKKYGPKPWDIVKKILAEFSGLEFRINTPEEDGVDRDSNFQLILTHTRNHENVSFADLSSGEKVLMALVASIYKATSDRHFPRLLLLDEIDASLHPSMIRNLLTVINDVFVKQGTSVILATHSPTTVALVPEAAVYVVNKGGRDRVVKATKERALSVLTEGFATLEQGLTLFDQVAMEEVSIFSEGRNIRYINKALKLAGIDSVEVIQGAENITCDTELKTFFKLFTSVPHANKVIFVWDWDVNSLPKDSENTYAFSFEKNPSNQFAKKGIENLFTPDLFTDEFLVQETSSDGQITPHFNSDKKKSFEEKILARNNPSDFAGFGGLISKVRSLLPEANIVVASEGDLNEEAPTASDTVSLA